MRNALHAITAALCLAGPGAAFGHPHTTLTTNEDLAVSGSPTIVVDSNVGAITVTPGAPGAVHVVAERRADSEAEARQLPVSAAIDGNTVRIQFKDAARRSGDGREVSFRIVAPPACHLKLRTGAGAISVERFTGGVEADSGGGAVHIVDARGAVRVHTGGGAVGVHRLSGSVEVETGGGVIAVDGALSGRNRVVTGGGLISVAIPADSKLKVEGQSGSGNAHNQFGLPAQGSWPLEHSAFRGTLGDGSAGSLEMHTGGGALELRKL
jgi:hypothetical protein